MERIMAAGLYGHDFCNPSAIESVLLDLFVQFLIDVAFYLDAVDPTDPSIEYLVHS
jgi:hypothetical protein